MEGEPRESLASQIERKFKGSIMRAALISLLACALLGGTAYAVSYTPWTKNIYSVSQPETNTTNIGKTRVPTVSVFDDGNNKCYVLMDNRGTPQGISCVVGN